MNFVLTDASGNVDASIMTFTSDTDRWCSGDGSFGSSGMGVEVLVVALSTPVQPTGFQLGQADGMNYNPRDYTVTGIQEDGTVCTLYEAKDFDFESSGQVVKHSMIASPKCGEPGIIYFSISLSVESNRVNRLMMSILQKRNFVTSVNYIC